MRSLSCSFIWQPNVRSTYRGSTARGYRTGPSGRLSRPPPRRSPAPPRRGRTRGPRPLLRVFDRARLADDGDLDLARVLELLLDLLRDVPGEHLRGEVVDVVGLDHHAHVATRLHRVDLLDPGVVRADLLEPLEPLHVRLEALPPSAGSAARDVVGDLRDHRLDGALLDLAVVRLDAVDDLGRLLHPPSDLGAD